MNSEQPTFAERAQQRKEELSQPAPESGDNIHTAFTAAVEYEQAAYADLQRAKASATFDSEFALEHQRWREAQALVKQIGAKL